MARALPHAYMDCRVAIATRSDVSGVAARIRGLRAAIATRSDGSGGAAHVAVTKVASLRGRRPWQSKKCHKGQTPIKTLG